MTDRYCALTVLLADPIRADDAEAIIEAIKMIKGVTEVTPVVVDPKTYWAREDARRRLVNELWAVLTERGDQ